MICCIQTKFWPNILCNPVRVKCDSGVNAWQWGAATNSEWNNSHNVRNAWSATIDLKCEKLRKNVWSFSLWVINPCWIFTRIGSKSYLEVVHRCLLGNYRSLPVDQMHNTGRRWYHSGKPTDFQVHSIPLTLHYIRIVILLTLAF